MATYKLLSWTQADYSDAETEYFGAEKIAREYAQERVAEGYHAELSMILEEFEPDPVDMCVFNGVQPRYDFPMSLGI